jgi:hypothetical protein
LPGCFTGCSPNCFPRCSPVCSARCGLSSCPRSSLRGSARCSPNSGQNSFPSCSLSCLNRRDGRRLGRGVEGNDSRSVRLGSWPGSARCDATSFELSNGRCYEVSSRVSILRHFPVNSETSFLVSFQGSHQGHFGFQIDECRLTNCGHRTIQNSDVRNQNPEGPNWMLDDGRRTVRKDGGEGRGCAGSDRLW